MSMTDPIADMLTRIRNGNRICMEKVDLPYSVIKEGCLKVLQEEGYIREFASFGEGKRKTLRVFLKYGPQKEFVINRIDRQSSPGRRLYKKVADLEPVMDGIGIAVLSTPQGILSDRQCRERNVGGEILFTVW